MKLEDIGFYTLSDARFRGDRKRLWRCELIVTDRCNFRCAYCRELRTECRGELSLTEAERIIDLWIADGLKNVRFSGGEPTLYPYLGELVKRCKAGGVERIAISTNGSAGISTYYKLYELGVNDFSISLDACCASFAERIAGRLGVFGNIETSIRELSKLTYVTVGIVVTNENYSELVKIIEYADRLGVSDIRIISAAQEDFIMEGAAGVSGEILSKHPILAYRIGRIREGRGVRGIGVGDSHRCHVVLDDMAVAGGYHFPCIIYLREGGAPIGKMDSRAREARLKWSLETDTHTDRICSKNCLDCIVEANNRG